MQQVTIYDSMQRKKVIFKPIDNEIKMYVCGMTVYDLCHIGHARVMIFFDVVKRYFESIGYSIKYVRNITDVDDKIIKKSQDEGCDCSTITEKYITAMQEDAIALGNLAPHSEPKATDYIPNMIAMIETLIEKGLAYQSQSGDVCFSVASFPKYGALARRSLEDLIAGHRVAEDSGKENPLDFVLWKLSKEGEPSWDSPWGAGRPGWHIECSTMSKHLLAETIDIHGGGVDLQFPHHENEIAQSEGASGKEFVRNWMHVGSVQVNNEKMSKSLGNFFTIREVLADYSADTVRYFMLSSHYRHPIQFSKENLVQAERNIDRMYVALRPFGDDIDANDQSKYYEDFASALADDFNTPKAFAIMAEQVKRINIASGEDALSEARVLKAMATVVGLLTTSASSYFKKDAEDAEIIEKLVKERSIARGQKDWAKADAIRKQLLEEYCVEVDDTAIGGVWRRI